MSKKSESSGYTLIEILAVLVVITIILSIASPRISKGFQIAKLKTAVRQMAAALRAARSYAVAQRGVVTVSIDFETSEYHFEARLPQTSQPHAISADEAEYQNANQNTADSGSSQYQPEFLRQTYTLPPDVIFESFRLETNETVSVDKAYIRFFPKGHSTGGIITIALNDGRRYFIQVNRVTGRVKIESEDETD
ncbi:GspH/FimT family pseudopilin [bacterium]|nr:GspH/FimT family pseudopilin [candidate division CSSED10-310 bacterium]